ncbi:hypothetical protein H4Q26_015946 [Puccinia striiformis f. sp. tritici PST-130]|uniref:Uncharacterized protein n=1 Tax=Puccinia striiformis f. sp. tritici PST-78 TaxID=1165861 RepID=A0A0L0W506_9BASI|nr:hypothetical protein H4Q26_015946 [Puccinia striiformis f. sp. tritici PST-130]KNF06537.1 hypothetical protein PSTG_00411 [Puccinia striiformis f. sp. tritici PST-78]
MSDTVDIVQILITGASYLRPKSLFLFVGLKARDCVAVAAGRMKLHQPAQPPSECGPSGPSALIRDPAEVLEKHHQVDYRLHLHTRLRNSWTWDKQQKPPSEPSSTPRPPNLNLAVESERAVLDLQTLWDTSKYFSLEACSVYLGWYIYLVLCWLILPGRWVKGTVLRDGTQLSYKINAFNTLMFTVALTAAIFAEWGNSPLLYIVDHYVELITATLGGNNGNVICDWFIGCDLNPQIGNFDINTFNEMQPSLTLGVLLDFCCVLKQSHNFGKPSNSILLTLNIFQFWEVLMPDIMKK